MVKGYTIVKKVYNGLYWDNRIDRNQAQRTDGGGIWSNHSG